MLTPVKDRIRVGPPAMLITVYCRAPWPTSRARVVTYMENSYG